MPIKERRDLVTALMCSGAVLFGEHQAWDASQKPNVMLVPADRIVRRADPISLGPMRHRLPNWSVAVAYCRSVPAAKYLHSETASHR